MLVATFALEGCSSDYSAVVANRQEDGWSVVEVLGEVDGYIHQTNLESDTAKAVEASWIINGERRTKLYSQQSQLYLVLRFKKADDDVFAVIMSKRR
ncbi:MAG: hypothetical protein CMJ96_06080 [Planctomycetes bacterium]|nr:hypothetical protein [Planctomycetota bacterium]|tara:strand:+ start:1330 stop:1620 length:291 start_codon:yes stop_codon:yes gene_type:complete